MAKKKASAAEQILGAHPGAHSIFGPWLTSVDGESIAGVPHRTLAENPSGRTSACDQIAVALVAHHASAERVKRHKEQLEALKRSRYPKLAARTGVFPSSVTTKRGNFAEVVLAEYVRAGANAEVPVYRLRYNPNVDQSMKGDDVLAFDFKNTPPRILVGEAKFRSTPSKAAVEELIGSLTKSRSGRIPVSLQFVAERLFELGDSAKGEMIHRCAEEIAAGKVRVQYVGLLLSDDRASDHVTKHASASLRELVVVSLGASVPAALVNSAFKNAEKSL